MLEQSRSPFRKHKKASNHSFSVLGTTVEGKPEGKKDGRVKRAAYLVSTLWSLTWPSHRQVKKCGECEFKPGTRCLWGPGGRGGNRQIP